MCHPSDTDHMPVDTTWGILSPSGMNPSISVLQCLIIMLLTVFFYSYGPSTSLSRGVEFFGKDFQQNKVRGEDVGQVDHA